MYKGDMFICITARGKLTNDYIGIKGCLNVKIQKRYHFDVVRAQLFQPIRAHIFLPFLAHIVDQL